ncbi:unnamed protein product, partial [Pleuronectes platessa]
TSDTETRDSCSLIDPGTEQYPPSPAPDSASSGSLDSSPKEEKMEASSPSASSLLQETFVQGDKPGRQINDLLPHSDSWPLRSAVVHESLHGGGEPEKGGRSGLRWKPSVGSASCRSVKG